MPNALQEGETEEIKNIFRKRLTYSGYLYYINCKDKTRSKGQNDMAIQSLTKRYLQLKSLMSKFKSVKSLIRKWAFELTQLEGKIEDFYKGITTKPVKQVEKVAETITINVGSQVLNFPVKNEGDSEKFKITIKSIQKLIANATAKWSDEYGEYWQFNGRASYGVMMGLQEMMKVYKNSSGNGGLKLEDMSHTYMINWRFPGNFVSQANKVLLTCDILTNNRKP